MAVFVEVASLRPVGPRSCSKRQCRTALSIWLAWIRVAPPGMALQMSAARVWGNNQSLREALRVEKVRIKLVSYRLSVRSMTCDAVSCRVLLLARAKVRSRRKASSMLTPAV